MDLFADVLCLCCYVLQETWRPTETPLEDSCQMLTKDTQTTPPPQKKGGRPTAAHSIRQEDTVNIFLKYIYLEAAMH
jgi:hypothetical protein